MKEQPMTTHKLVPVDWMDRAAPMLGAVNSTSLDENEHCCEWTLRQERKRLHAEFAAAPEVSANALPVSVRDALQFYADNNEVFITFASGQREDRLKHYRGSSNWREAGEDNRGHERFIVTEQKAQIALQELDEWEDSMGVAPEVSAEPVAGMAVTLVADPMGALSIRHWLNNGLTAGNHSLYLHPPAPQQADHFADVRDMVQQQAGELPTREEQKEFEQWYVENAHAYEKDPIGSRDCGLQRKAWFAGRAALKGNG